MCDIVQVQSVHLISIQVELRHLMGSILQNADRLSFVNHLTTIIESVLGAERLLKPKPELLQTSPPQIEGQHETPPSPEGVGGSTVAAIGAVARDLQTALWQPNTAPTGLYFLFSVVNKINENLLTKDRQISLFTPIDMSPLLRQIGQSVFGGERCCAAVGE